MVLISFTPSLAALLFVGRAARSLASSGKRSGGEASEASELIY